MPISPKAAGFIVRAANAARKAMCWYINERAKDGRDPYLDPLRTLSGLKRNRPIFFPGAAVLTAACDIAPPPFTSDEFDGGQCDCIEYICDYEFRELNQPVFRSQGIVRGPVLGSRMKKVPIESGGETIAFVINASRLNDAGVCEPHEFIIRSSDDLLYARLLSVTRADGLPDDCGNPPPPPPSSVPNPFPWSFDWENENGVSITTNVNVTVGGISFSPRGEINTSVSMNFQAGFSFQFNFNASGQVTLIRGPGGSGGSDSGGGSSGGGSGFSGGDGAGGSERHPDNFSFDIDISIPEGSEVSIPEGSEGKEPDENSEESPERIRIIRGVAVTTVDSRSNRPTLIFQDDNPDIFAPSLGHVNFRVRIGKNATFWTNDIPVKNVKAFIPCPWEGGAVEVAGTPQPGVRWILTPVYALAEEIILSL